MKRKPTRLRYGLFHTLNHLSQPSRLTAQQGLRLLRCPAETPNRTDATRVLALSPSHHAASPFPSHSGRLAGRCFVWLLSVAGIIIDSIKAMGKGKLKNRTTSVTQLFCLNLMICCLCFHVRRYLNLTESQQSYRAQLPIKS